MTPQLAAFYEVILAHPRAESFLISVSTARQLLWDLFRLPNPYTWLSHKSMTTDTLTFMGKRVNMSPGMVDDVMLPIYTTSYQNLHELTKEVTA